MADELDKLDELDELYPQKFDTVKSTDIAAKGLSTISSIPPALISLPYPLPADKVWNVARRVAAEHLADPLSLGLFVCGTMRDGFYWDSSDVDLNLVTRGQDTAQTGTHQLHDNIPVALAHIPLSLLVDPKPDQTVFVTALAFAQMVEGSQELATVHKQLQERFHTLEAVRGRVENCRRTAQALLAALADSTSTLTREWTAVRLFREALGPGLCHLDQHNVTNRRMLDAVMAVCLHRDRPDWTAASLTLLGMDAVDEITVGEALTATRDYLREHEAQLRTWHWPNHITAELYYGAAIRLAVTGRAAAALFCLRSLIAAIQPRLAKPLPTTLNAVLLPTDPDWSARLTAGEHLLQGLDPMLITEALPRG